MLQVIQACGAECWPPQRSKFLCCLSFSPAFLLSTSFPFLLMVAVTVSDYYQSNFFQRTTVCFGYYQNSTDWAMLELLTCSWVGMLTVPGQDTSRTKISPESFLVVNGTIYQVLTWQKWQAISLISIMRSTLTWHKSKQFPKVPFAQIPRFHHMNADI